MMDNPFLDDPAEMMVRSMEEEEFWEEDDYPEDEEDDPEEDWGEIQVPPEDIDRRPPIRPTKEPRRKDRTEIGVDRNGVFLNVGDRVKLVGSRRESTVHFNGSMNRFLNTDKILTIREVRPYSPHPCFKIHGADDWSWSHMNVEKVLIDPPKKAEPTMFDPSLLDL